MSKTNLRPKSLPGIKTLAHDLKVHAGVTHTVGLNMAAELAGFANYKAALNRHSKTGAAAVPPRYPLFISIWWRDPSTRLSGRETIRIETARPIDELFPLKTMRHARYLRGLKRLGPDHLAYRGFNAGQNQARTEAAGAARTIAFIEATGLVPSGNSKKEYPQGRAANSLPGHDHTGVWFDPEAKQYVVTDEPYLGKLEESPYAGERAKWASEWGIDIRHVAWGGMYYPDGGSRLFVFTEAKDDYDLGRVVDQLNALPDPVGSTEWTGESARSIFEFVTPGTVAEQALKSAEKAQRPKAQPRTGPRNSIPYHGIFSDRRSRPAAKLPIFVHERMGELLKGAMGNVRVSSRQHGQLGVIRSELEDWFAGEYPSDQIDREHFLRTYYKDLKDTSLIAAPEQRAVTALAQIDELRATLLAHYPESAPLRHMLTGIDKVRVRLA